MTLTKLRIIARRRWPLVALATVLCLGAVFLVTLATEDEPSTVPEVAGPDSYVATGVVSVDRLQLFDPTLDPGLMILEVEEAGLYEQAAEELGVPGGSDALREFTQIFPGTIPGLGSSTDTEEEDEQTSASDPNAVPTNEAILIQVSNLDGETATVQADVLASTWATIANLIDQEELDSFTDTIGEEIAAVEEQLIAFDQANPRIALLDRPVEPGDAFLMAQRQGLQTQLDALTQVLTEQSASIRTAPAFVKLSTQDAQLASQLATSEDTTTEKLTSFTVDWVLPVVVGLLLALGLVFLLEKLFPRVDTRDDIQDELGVPVLAEVPA